MIDETQIVLTYLEAQAALTAITSGRIWADVAMPPADYKPADGVGICFKLRGGSDDDTNEVLSGSFQFKIYAADEPTARSAKRILYSVLQDAKNKNILSSRRESLGVTLKEPATDWTYVLVYYSIMVLNLPSP